MEKLKPYIEINDELFNNENGFFTQLPFIETIAADALICPLLIGQMTLAPENNNKIRGILNILKKLLEKEGTVLVCTSDLAHINGHFEHKFTNYINQHIRKSDSETLQFLYNIIDGVKTRMNKIDEMLFLQNSPSCGIFAMYIFGKLLNLFTKAQSGIQSSDSSGSNNSSSSLNNNLEYKKYFHSRVSCYYTSLGREYLDVFNFNKNQLIHLFDINDISDAKKSSISYAGVVFTTQGNIQTRRVRKIELICSEYEKIALLGIAKEQLFYKLSSKHGLLINAGLSITSKIPDGLIRPIASPIFKLNLGVFVTLYKNDELRGCIGTLETDNDEATIESNVKKYVLEAATKDTRFKPVEISEFNKLEFSITILYTMKPITLNEYFGSKFVLGRDGILLSQGTGHKQGYFLPSVATEFKYDKQKLLEELCVNKIGLNTKECFRSSNTTLFYNEGLEFTTK
jgi:AmmeMemoRadiSam system protein A